METPQPVGDGFARERFEMGTAKNGIASAAGRGATMTHESRTHRLCATGGASSTQGVSKMRRPLSRRLLSQELLLLGSVSGDGVRSVDLPGKLARHRGMSSFRARQTVSHGVPRSSGALDVGGCERIARLAHLRGL